MTRLLAIAAAALIVASCGGPLATDPKPTPDTPRYESADVYGRITNRRLETDKFTERATSCTRDQVSYAGAGVWRCGNWRFDERTGDLFTVR